MRSRMVPAWTAQVSEHSAPGFVYVLDEAQVDPLMPDRHKTKVVDALTPVRVVAEDPDGLKVVRFR